MGSTKNEHQRKLQRVKTILGTSRSRMQNLKVVRSVPVGIDPLQMTSRAAHVISSAMLVNQTQNDAQCHTFKFINIPSKFSDIQNTKR